ncbi:MAG: DNA mismatch repair endonuclease MutL [Prevotella sp.]|uniref:DNA mismatch repair endonuclease MutL n=1 Tax=Prevotella sp. TaxID=59823 RepID=UPI002A2F11B6|nr:DNA mismatch repair endonuclease MutL [Prevotella sp.]MDD7317815.1 DNA mismatch repair endonuclease MutL [Prevotellaceae bacterium]MDY4020730.1 DNA mismatch repair endonuclease MutL [Prevotella sp.]
MGDIIQLLPDSVANQIAAGEVIQRPASVIKELVENAIDAGATMINVSVVDAGRTAIQVIDNGRGMTETDARLAFERHATSKIRKADDLFALNTMGFRGEALASIAAVAQVELKTRVEGDEIGTRLSISGSRLVKQEPTSCPVGSNFSVENLFFNVPVRRKFLKSNTTELNNILTAFERIVLVYPQVGFTFHNNGVEVFNLKPASIHQRIVDVFGKKINQDLLPINVDTTVCRISGFVGKPESARKKMAHQYLFVNGRYMKHGFFHKGVMQAYERLIASGDQVPYFIYFKVAPENIDVNIHPTKTEIKFDNEVAIWQILTAAVKDSLGRFNDVSMIDFNVEGKPEIPVFDSSGSAFSVPKVDYNPQYNPFKEGDRAVYQHDNTAQNWEKLYEGLSQRTAEEKGLFDEEAEPAERLIDEKAPTHYQYKGQYIMTAVKSGLMIIDQERAHVRILYDRYMQQMKAKGHGSQKILFPEVVQFPPSDIVALEKMMPEMEHLGFELTDLGGGSYAVNGIPSGIEGMNIGSLIKDMVETAIESGAVDAAEIDHSLALSLAHNAAIPHGQVLGNDEMETIVGELFATSNANYTPDGKLILSILKQNEMEQMLG